MLLHYLKSYPNSAASVAYFSSSSHRLPSRSFKRLALKGPLICNKKLPMGEFNLISKDIKKKNPNLLSHEYFIISNTDSSIKINLKSTGIFYLFSNNLSKGNLKYKNKLISHLDFALIRNIAKDLYYGLYLSSAQEFVSDRQLLLKPCSFPTAINIFDLVKSMVGNNHDLISYYSECALVLNIL